MNTRTVTIGGVRYVARVCPPRVAAGARKPRTTCALGSGGIGLRDASRGVVSRHDATRRLAGTR